MEGSNGEAMSPDIAEVIDSAPLTVGLVRIVLLCGLAAMIDGFDTQILSFVAPVLARDWDIHPSAFGVVFAAGLMGIMVGQLAIAPLADRFGRKVVILSCMAAFGLLSIATAFAPDVEALLALRFVGGIGLGAVTPNLIALTAEYSPRRLRATAVTTMFGGFSLGAVAGGLLSSVLVPAHGWPIMFIIGGLVPLGVAAALVFALPESIRFLLVQRGDPEAAARTLKAYWPARSAVPGERLIVDEAPLSGFSIRHLFGPDHAATTFLLWPIYFIALLLTYVLLSWLPTILVREGIPLPEAQQIGAVLSLGGIIGGIALGIVTDRLEPLRVLVISYGLTAVSIAMIGQVEGSGLVLTATAFAAGFFTLGSQTALNAAAANLYPTAIRATGLGYAMGVGRMGSIVGPVIGGVLIAAEWQADALFVISAVPALAASGLLLMLSAARHRKG